MGEEFRKEESRYEELEFGSALLSDTVASNNSNPNPIMNNKAIVLDNDYEAFGNASLENTTTAISINP